jgi:adenylate cyclase
MVAMEKNENGLTKMLSGCDALEKTGTVLGLSGARAQLVDALLRLERYDEALSVLNMVQNEKAVTGTHCWDSELERLRGDLLAKRSEDGLCEAEIWYRKALETARRQHARSLELRAAVSLSKALRAQGRFHEISNTLSVTIDKFPRELATPEIVEARGIVNESRDGSALKMPSARLRR